jgi:hypothetical protein
VSGVCNEEEKYMSIPAEKLKINENARKEMIKNASKLINQKYDQAFKLISKN